MQYGALHPQSRAFIGSWRALNGLESDQAAANTLSIDASSLLNRLFLAQRADGDVFIFRTIGKDLTVWTGRDLRDHAVISLFQGADRPLLAALIDSAIAAPGPALARACAFGLGQGQRCEIELVVLPLLEQGVPDRILGLFQPIGSGLSVAKPVLRLALTAILPPAPQQPARPALRLVVST